MAELAEAVADGVDGEEVSVVQSTLDPTKYGVVGLNPDWSDA